VMKTGKPGRPSAEVNAAAVDAAEMSGTRQKSLDLMLVGMGVLGIHQRRTYTRHSCSVQDAMVQLGHQQIITNRRTVRAFHVEQGAEADERNHTPVTVSADGSWPVRSACSACGHWYLIFRDDRLADGTRFIIAYGCVRAGGTRTATPRRWRRTSSSTWWVKSASTATRCAEVGQCRTTRPRSYGWSMSCVTLHPARRLQQQVSPPLRGEVSASM